MGLQFVGVKGACDGKTQEVGKCQWGWEAPPSLGTPIGSRSFAGNFMLTPEGRAIPVPLGYWYNWQQWGEGWVLRGSPCAWGGCPLASPSQPRCSAPALRQRDPLLAAISLPVPSCVALLLLIFFKANCCYLLKELLLQPRAVGEPGGAGACAHAPAIFCIILSNWLGLASPSPAPPRALLAHLALLSYLLVHIFQALICLFCKAAALPRFDLPMISRASLGEGLIWCRGCRAFFPRINIAFWSSASLPLSLPPFN